MDEVLAHNKENVSANFGETSESSQVFPEGTPKSDSSKNVSVNFSDASESDQVFPESTPKSQLISLAYTIYRDQAIDMAYKNSANITKEFQDRLPGYVPLCIAWLQQLLHHHSTGAQLLLKSMRWQSH